MAPAPKTAPSPKSSQPPPKSPPPLPSPPPPRKSPPPPSSPRPTKKTSRRAFDSPPGHVVHNQSTPPATHKSTKSPSHKAHHDKSVGGSHTRFSNASYKEIVLGLVLAAIVFVLFITICVTCAKRRRRRKKRQKAAAYYNKPPPATGSGDYYNRQWADSPHEYVIQFTRPGMMGIPVGVGGKWGASASHQPNTSGNLSPSALHTPKMSLAFSMSNFSYNDLSTATGGFSQFNLLGQGGFGYVHKGVLPDGHEVAVKSLKSGSNQGEREFQAEVEIISRVHHRHLVSLVGYCIADAQRMLVYEYVPNRTLDFHLHGKGCPVMKWETRICIALGSARGLAYLHEDCDPRIIHRDIKSSNILLDHNFEAKVADFGLAKLASLEDTHVSTRVMGTFGYLAPEYASSGKLTEKSDVFSFGVMLLELLTGKKPIDPTFNSMEDSLVEWAGPLLVEALENRNYNELVDPRLEGNYEPNEVARMVSSAAASIRHAAKRRPKMSQIVRALEGDVSLDALNDALKPQRVDSTLSLSSLDTPTSIVNDTKAYNSDMRAFREMAEPTKSSEEASS